MKLKTKQMIYCALFAALTSICSQISIPLQFTPVPINLATFAVILSGCILGYKLGTLSQLVYIILGAVGAPVFANFTGGIGKLMGPTGGYIVGYALCALFCGLICEKTKLKNKKLLYILSMIGGILSCYTLGTAWYVFITHTGVFAALTTCVFPFIFGDILKIILALLIVDKLKIKNI